jgi:hypothetical protein
MTLLSEVLSVDLRPARAVARERRGDGVAGSMLATLERLAVDRSQRRAVYKDLATRMAVLLVKAEAMPTQRDLVPMTEIVLP